MNGLPDLLTFAAVMALGQFSPGPDMLLLTRTSLADGGRAGVLMALGIATGLSLHAALAIGGMALVLEREAWLSKGLSWAAAAYLIWLAYGLARAWFAHVYAGSKISEAAPRGSRGPFVRGLLCNLLNPKVMVFLAAVTAPFLAGDRPLWWPRALWAIVVFEGMLLWTLWAQLLQWKPMRDRYLRVGPWIDLGFALVLAVLAGRLVLG